MNPRWLHLDINAYFATLLQQENPALRGRPVGVVKDVGRTCVIAASKEAKLKGVKTGCGAQEALQLAPDMVFVPAQFDMAMAATRRLKKLFENTAPHVEIFSLDEAFIDLSDCERLHPNAHTTAQVLQQQIKQELGEWVTCNVGISYNRMLAKLASEVSSKGSVVEITRQNLDHYLINTPFAAVCGVGMRLEQRLQQLGVTHPYHLNLVSDEDLLTEFGPHWSQELRKIGHGEEPSFLLQSAQREHQPMKSVGRSITGFKPCDDETTIKQVLYNLTAEVVHKARRMKLAGRSVGISLTDKRSKYWHTHKTLSHAVFHTSEMFDILYHQLYGAWQRDFPVMRYSVHMGRLESWDTLNPSLLPDWQKDEQLSQAIDSLSMRYGLYGVRSGVMTDMKTLIHPEVTGFLGDKQYQFLS